MIIDNEFLDKNRTKNGAWKRRQLEIVGVKWPPKKGWKAKIIGKKISKDDAKEFELIAIRTFSELFL